MVIDPLASFLAGSANVENTVREATNALTAVAERTGAAIVAVRHLCKSPKSSALYRGAGSIALIAAARSALLVGRDPKNSDRRVVAQFKSSIGPISESLAFQIMPAEAGMRVEWLGATNCDSEQLLLASSTGQQPAREEARGVLYAILAQGPVPANEAIACARDAGVSPTTLRRAKEDMNVPSKRVGFGPNSVFNWELPDCGVNEVVDRFRRLEGENIDELMELLISEEPDASKDAIANHWETGDGDSSGELG